MQLAVTVNSLFCTAASMLVDLTMLVESSFQYQNRSCKPTKSPLAAGLQMGIHSPAAPKTCWKPVPAASIVWVFKVTTQRGSYFSRGHHSIAR
ncbi:hypothetical protein A6R68_00828 [Neotoma lepida]|uniref:Secreted protein n=1 Tax=Neotoma lepida TaxID=56216 RepID=A0A1A6GWU5_NEOLE|nr:hypothetical protein A6R68_00828 [Neotoma lepida]